LTEYLTVSRNGVDQFTYTTDGSYPNGDVGIDAYTPAFTFAAWEGGDTAGGTSRHYRLYAHQRVGWDQRRDQRYELHEPRVAFNGVSASFTVTSDTAIEATVPEGATTGPLSVDHARGTPTTSTKQLHGAGDSDRNECGHWQRHSSPQIPSAQLRRHLLGLLRIRYGGDADGNAANGVDLHRLERMRCGFWRDLYREHERAEIGHHHLYPADVHLSVSKASLLIGDGTVTSSSNPDSPDQIDCGPTCSASYG